MFQPLRIFSRAWTCYRTHGPVETLCRSLHRIGLVSECHALEIFLKELGPSTDRRRDGEAKPIELQGHRLTVRETLADEAQRLRYADGLQSLGWIREQFARGSRLITVLSDEEVIATGWLNTRIADLTHIKRPVVYMPERCVYLYGALVAPGFKSRGIGKTFVQHVMTLLQREGYRWAIVTVYLENLGAVRWQLAIGYQYWGRVTYLRWWKRDFWWTRLTDVGRRHPDLLNGRERQSASQ